MEVLIQNIGGNARSFEISSVKGIQSCKKCHGLGYRKSKSQTDRFRTCNDCVKASGKCYFCNNEGILIQYPNERCTCEFGAKLKI